MREATKSTPIVEMTQQPRSAVHVSTFMATEGCSLAVEQFQRSVSNFDTNPSRESHPAMA